MKILALDPGKFKTVACNYVKHDGRQDSFEFTTVDTLRSEFTKLIKRHNADVLVFETCTTSQQHETHSAPERIHRCVEQRGRRRLTLNSGPV